MSKPEVALLIKTETDWHRDVVRGISQYAQVQGGWRFTVPKSNEEGEVFLPPDWSGQGVICRLTSQELLDAIRQREIPAINISWLFQHSDMPKVISDERACARMALEYFVKKQYQNFGYIGFPPWCGYAPTIEQTLHTELDKLDHPLRVFPLSSHLTTSAGIDAERLADWLRDQPKPLAMVVWSSRAGYETLMACELAELDVPADVAMICLEHDLLWSELAPVPLSNLDPDPARVGYRAAQQLHELMLGGESPAEPVRIPPLAVQQRLSSDATSVKDPVLRLALSYIQDHASDGVTVSEVARLLGVSRRFLEIRFRRDLNCTPGAHIRRVQLESVARLLRMTNLPIQVIAQRTGYQHPEVLMRAFKREYALTPMQFRQSGTLEEPTPTANIAASAAGLLKR